MRTHRILRPTLLALLVFAVPALAQQPAPPTSALPSVLSGAATQPSAATAPVKKELVVPPGFRVISENDHSILVENADEAWTRKALTTLKPATMPTTMPTELLAQIHVKRAEMVQRIISDLGLTDKAETEKFFAEALEPAIQKMETIRPNLFYIATTEARLEELMRSGWSNDRFHYNRAAEKVELNTNLDISSDDDLLLPAIFPADATPEKKAQILSDSISTTEARILEEIANRAMIETHRALRAYLITHVLPPLSVKDDQAWFVVGVGDVLAARYFAQITGASLNIIMLSATADNPNSPVRPATIDLLHPANAADLRPQALPAYRDAYNRKATRVIYNWLTRAGDAVLPKVLTEARKNPPADGAALLKLIQQLGGTDLAPETRPAG